MRGIDCGSGPLLNLKPLLFLHVELQDSISFCLRLACLERGHQCAKRHWKDYEDIPIRHRERGKGGGEREGRASGEEGERGGRREIEGLESERGRESEGYGWREISEREEQ